MSDINIQLCAGELDCKCSVCALRSRVKHAAASVGVVASGACSPALVMTDTELKRQQTIRELIDTEEKFVKDLVVVIEVSSTSHVPDAVYC